MDLTSQQRAVVEAPPTTRVVFAAPGSGKTATLIEHVSYLLKHRIVAPGEIMALTYTRKAAHEMKQRLLQVPGIHPAAVEAVRVGTFHAQLFAALLGRDPSIPRIMDGEMQSQLIRKALQAEGQTLNQWRLRDWQQTLSTMASHSGKYAGRRERSVLRRYKRLKRNANVWDFDDILIESFHALTKYGAAKVFKQHIAYLLVDEFQDTNELQFAILRTLVSGFSARLFVVGDDDQSIYSFRGASPHYLNHFHDVFPNALESELTVNFRSSGPLLQPAWRLIVHNQRRRSKQFSAFRTDGDPMDVRVFPTQRAQYEFVARAIRSEKDQFAHSGVAVLARTRRQLQLFMTAASTLGGAVVSTFHEAKGREWDSVYILDASQPNPYVLLQPTEVADDEEERRLFYVAMTRAKYRLTLCVPQSMGQMRVRPSQFLVESGMDIDDRS